MVCEKVIILLATFNRSHLIRQTLDSILAQSYLNWECLIVDDCSTDNTNLVVQAYCKKDKRFIYFLKPPKYPAGLSGTRNCGMDLAAERDADFIQFFDDDDIMHPQKLELQIAPLLKDATLHFTVCRYDKFFENRYNQRIIQDKSNMEFPHLGDAILTGRLKMNSLGPLWRKSFIDQFRFDEDLRYAEEWELYIRLGYKFPGNYEIVNESLFQYRKHEDSLTLGMDINYERRKSSSVSRIKIFEYLTRNKLHTTTSITFLAKTFLIISYNPSNIKRLQYYVKDNKNFNNRILWFLFISGFLTRFNRKIITKLATWV